MTDEQWEAGRELDAEIARVVFGHDLIRIPTVGPLMGEGWYVRGETAGNVAGPVPAYSTEIGAAWQIVERHGGYLSLRHAPPFQSLLGTPSRWYCRLFAPQHCEVVADSAPLAICLAALKCGTLRDVYDSPSPPVDKSSSVC